jgi:hypothetical protein
MTTGSAIKPKYFAKFGSELVVTPVNPLAPRTVITIDKLPWVGYIGPDGAEAPGVYTKTLADPASDNFFMLVRAEPGAIGPPHWHLSDTIYIVRFGELTVPGEATYRVGDVRWVQGGFAYGGEVPGPEGVEFFFISLGPYGMFFPDDVPPPLGRWDDPA